MALIDWVDWIAKGRPVRSPKDQPAAGASIWLRGSRSTVPYRDIITAHQALAHPILFRILHKLALSVASVQWMVEEDPNVKVVDKPAKGIIKALNDLLHSPSDTLAEDQLRYWIALNYASYGRVPFKIGVNTAGLPNGIYGLDAQYVKAVIDDRGLVRHYKYGVGENAETLPTRKVAERNKAAYAYEIVTPNLSGNFETGKNITPLQAAGLPADVISLLLRRAGDTAAGHPNAKYIIAAEKTLSKQQKAALKDQINDSETGEDESGHILFLYNTKVEVHTLANDLSDIHSKMPMDDMTRMIAGLFGVPVALLGLGAADGAKFAGNYSESRASFWEDTIIPGYLSPIATGLTAAICPYGARVRFDYDTIEALNEARAAKAKSLEKVTFLTDDEKRELCGFAPRKKPAPQEPGTSTNE